MKVAPALEGLTLKLFSEVAWDQKTLVRCDVSGTNQGAK